MKYEIFERPFGQLSTQNLLSSPTIFQRILIIFIFRVMADSPPGSIADRARYDYEVGQEEDRKNRIKKERKDRFAPHNVGDFYRSFQNH